jgi:hypothetical protein
MQMREWRIKDKVIKLMNFKDDKAKIKRLEVEREIARVGNLLATEFEIILAQAKLRMISVTQQILKDELK